MEKRPKVLFFIHLPPPWHGSSIVGKTIAENKLINEVFKCNFINLLASTNLKETGKIGFKKIIRFFILYIKVFVLLLKNRPRLCYFALTVSGIGFYKDLLLIMLIKAFHIKIVYHLHNKGISLYQNKILNRICYKIAFQDSEVILLSRYLYPDISLFVQKENIHICPNGIIELKQPYISNKNINDIPRILFLSNLIKSKGVLVLLKACAIIKRKGIPFQCLYVGEEGDLSVSIFNDTVIKMDLQGYVRYLGRKYGEEKEKIIAEADILAFPTYYSKETFGLVNLEAMQHSLPVISTFEGGIPDVVENGVTGFLVPQRNVELLAEKLELLIKDQNLRKKMGKAGRDKFFREFTLDIFQHRMATILKQILEKGCKKV